MSEPMIRLTDVTKTFPGAVAPAVGSLSMEIAEGEIVMLVGPSGCGKTTTLKMINRLVEPTSGSIKVAGQEVTTMAPHELRRGIGYVIQQIGLFPHKTIAENICVVPELLGWDKERIGHRVQELVELVDLDPGMVDRYPPELSGGQRQRVGVARALAADPPVLLMDEPFGAVDPIVRGRLQAELIDLQARVRKTIVFVTHDIDEAIQLGDRVAILNVGGKLEQYAPPAEVLRDPANEFVADFLGSDRGIKRLSLIPISETELEDGPVVITTDSVQQANAVMQRYDIDWFIVKEGDRVTGWASRGDLEGAGTVGAITPRPFQTRLTTSSSMEEALDAIVSSHTRIAAVFDGERYEGIVTLDRVNEAVVS